MVRRAVDLCPLVGVGPIEDGREDAVGVQAALTEGGGRGQGGRRIRLNKPKQLRGTADRAARQGKVRKDTVILTSIVIVTSFVANLI